MKTHTLAHALIALAILTLSSGILHADIRPNPLFADGAVLQRDQPIPVWGTARNGEKVTVELAGQKVHTTAKDGVWRVDLKPLSAGGPFTMTLTGDNTVTVNNLFVGEVWICSGQSNMELKFIISANAAEERPKANYPKIRMFTVAKKPSPTPLSEVHGSWVECSPKTVNGFSAVGYFFARDLYLKLGVPIGMINTSYSATPAQAWTSIEGLSKDSALSSYRNAVNKSHATDPSALFNGMVNPLIPYAIKGGIWYQGESNTKESRLYQSLFPAMIADWRTKWNQGNFPFLFVQIAPSPKMNPEIREAQFLTLAKSTNTAMAVITDAGEGIHPPRKEPVGQRLALAARALAYGEKIEYSGPLYQSLQAKGNEIVLSFTHVGGGLVAKDGPLKGFTIAGADGKFVPASAKIEGSNILVSAASVTEPKAVRYGWDKVPDVNLFNQEGLPASPFRTDVK